LQYYDINLNWWGTCKSRQVEKLIAAMSSSVTLDENGAGWFPVPDEGFGPVPGEYY